MVFLVCCLSLRQSAYATDWKLSERCMPHSPQHCFELGNEEVTRGRKAEARAYFLRGCLNGLGVSCNRLGFLEEEQSQSRRAYHFYLLACDRDSDRGCSNLARLANEFDRPDLSEAARKKACGLGHLPTCKKLDLTPSEYYCSPALKNACHEFDQKYSERWAGYGKVVAAARMREQDQIIATIESQPAAKILEIDKSRLEEIPAATLAEKLDESTVASLNEEQIQKLPEKAVEEKAWSVSFLDSFKPGMNRLFSRLSSETASGYLAIRYGVSLVRNGDARLVSKMRTVGGLYETRGGVLKGLRFLIEDADRQSVSVEDTIQTLGWRKILLGYAYEIKLKKYVDSLHILPRIGRYDVAARLPVALNNIGEPIIRDIKLTNALSIGMEFDAEFAKFFYIVRGWIGRDFGFASAQRDTEVSSTRFGIDAFLKGGGFSLLGARVSTNYLIFAANESLYFNNDKPGGYNLEMLIPVGGLGLSASW
jgi:hypothetical protein